jgi:hypothetical protein
MAYSKAKLKSNGDETSPSFKTILNRKCIRQIFTYVHVANFCKNCREFHYVSDIINTKHIYLSYHKNEVPGFCKSILSWHYVTYVPCHNAIYDNIHNEHQPH